MTYTQKVCILFIFVAVGGCGQSPSIEIDSSLQPYYDRFKTEAEKHGRALASDKISIQYADDLTLPGRGETLGKCYFKKDIPIVQVSTFFKALPGSLGDLEREKIMFHELGHCLLHRKHTSETWLSPDNKEIEASLMIQTPIDVYQYKTYRAHYIQELFTK